MYWQGSSVVKFSYAVEKFVREKRQHADKNETAWDADVGRNAPGRQLPAKRAGESRCRSWGSGVQGQVCRMPRHRRQGQGSHEDRGHGGCRCSENERRGSEQNHLRGKTPEDACLQNSDTGSGERSGELHPLPEKVVLGERKWPWFSARSKQAPAGSVPI